MGVTSKNGCCSFRCDQCGALVAFLCTHKADVAIAVSVAIIAVERRQEPQLRPQPRRRCALCRAVSVTARLEEESHGLDEENCMTFFAEHEIFSRADTSTSHSHAA